MDRFCLRRATTSFRRWSDFPLDPVPPIFPESWPNPPVGLDDRVAGPLLGHPVVDLGLAEALDRTLDRRGILGEASDDPQVPQ